MPSESTHPRLESPAPGLLPGDRDLAEYHEAVDPGPSPLHRAVVGIGLGLGLGLVAALLTPRRPTGKLPGRRHGRPSGETLLSARSRPTGRGSRPAPR